MVERMNFGSIGEPFSLLANARFVILPVPYDLTTTYQSGARRGPGAIIEASCNMELYDEELRSEPYRTGIHTLPAVEPTAASPGEMVRAVCEKVRWILSLEKIPVMLGGEHSISVGAAGAMKERYPSIGVLHLDAHADMRDSYQGTRYSHACTGRRIFECCPLVQVGIRSMSAEEAEFIEAHDIATISPADMKKNRSWIKKVCDNLPEDVYVTIDLDVLDPSVMPATGTPEPGGIVWGEITALLKTISENVTIRGFDVVELCPIPGMVAPDFMAAKLAYRFMGYISAEKANHKG